MKVKTAFLGGKDFEASLKDLGSRVTAKNVAKRALDKGAEPIAEEWRRLVPEDEGDLKRSIKVGDKALTKSVRRFRRGAGANIVERYIGIDDTEDRVKKGGPRLAIYAPIKEFGDSNSPAQPAGRPAFERQKHASLDLIAVELRSEIDKAAARAAKKSARLSAKG